MKIFLRILTILILPLIFIGGVNYFFDPDYTLRKDYIPRLATALVNEKLVCGPMNINSRELKKQWIEKLYFDPEILILGSSRTMGLTYESFPNKSFFNASVTNCTFQDMYAFLNLFEKKSEKFPKTIIICADQWLFGDTFSEKRWLNNQVDFKEFLKKTNAIFPQKVPSKWVLQKEWIKELFSIRYLFHSLKQKGKTETFEIKNSIVPDKLMFLPDGSRHLPIRIINAPIKEINEKAIDYVFSSKDEYFKNLNPIQCTLFEKMIQYLKNKNCQIILFIPPYHPETYKLFKQSPKTSGIFKANQYVLNIAGQQGLQIIGDTNPQKLNLSNVDFYDGVHLKPQTLYKIFKSESANKENP